MMMHSDVCVFVSVWLPSCLSVFMVLFERWSLGRGSFGSFFLM